MITIISSTNRENSVSNKIAHIYQGILASKYMATDLIFLDKLPHDFTDTALYDKAGKNEAFNGFRTKMRDAEKMVFIVPEYNGSFPGVLKAFIDGLIFPDTFMDKKTALVGLSSGIQGAGLALSHLTDIFNYCGMNVLAHKPKLSRIEENLTENSLSKRYQDLLEEQADKLLSF